MSLQIRRRKEESPSPKDDEYPLRHGIRSNSSADGRDITTHNGTQASDCCDACAITPACSAWTLYQSVCYLKDSSDNRTKCSSCVSGLDISTDQQPVCTIYDDKDVQPDGNNFASAPAGTPTQCCDMCGFTPGCVAWMLYEGKCYMKPSFTGTLPCTGCVSGKITSGPKQQLPDKFPMAGITFTGGRYCPNVTLGSDRSNESLDHLASTGANWMSIVATQYQWNISSTSIFPLYDGNLINDTTSNYYEFITTSYHDVVLTIRRAHQLGLKVMLKPHVDILRDNKPSGRFWRGDIGGCPADWSPPPEGVKKFTEEEWDTWFESYEAFLLPYAQMSREEGVEMLSINCELYCPNRQESHWRSIVDATRKVYDGKLTVSQISGHEDEIKWWDAVDVIGFDAYYSLKGSTVVEVAYSWGEHKDVAKSLAKKYGKMVAYTEIGY